MNYSPVRYLFAKQPVDDRAINRHVLEVLARELAPDPSGLRILELGAGVGTMVSRLADWSVLKRAQYTLVDRDAESLTSARRHLAAWGRVTAEGERSIRVEKADAAFEVEFVCADMFAFLGAREQQQKYAAVFANAVLDLVDLEPTLPMIWQVLTPGALCWFTINFDGETIFLPEHPLDGPIIDRYHATMTAGPGRDRAGHSQTGRRMLMALPASGAQILAAGSSDWVVFPIATAGQEPAYPGDEAYFLLHLIETIRGALEADPHLLARDLESWVQCRQDQVSRAQLAFVAHQIDFLGRSP